MSKKHTKNNIINEFIIKYVNTTHETQYTTINDEVFYKFFNSDVFYDYDTKNIVKLFNINKLSYEAMQYLLKNIVDTYLVYIDNQYTNYKTVFKSELAINERIDNISVRNFNYIINKIVEWTISGKSFKIFIDEAKNDRKFNKNLLQFVVRSIGYSLYHKRYILYIIYKYAEAMNYETIIYLFDINIMWNRSCFDIHYKEFINKRFGEELFTLSDDLNIKLVISYKNDYIDNDIIDTLLTKLEDNSLFDKEDKNNKIIHIYDATYYEYGEIRLNRYILLFNYLVLTNRINDIKTLLLSLNISRYLIKTYNNSYGYYYNRLDKYTDYIHMYDWDKIDLKIFITVEIYRSLLYLDIQNEIMEKLVSVYASINMNIHNNYYENNSVYKITQYNINDEKIHYNTFRYKQLKYMIEYVKNTKKNDKNIDIIIEQLMSLANIIAITK